jgi:hypothetical protein
MLQATCCQLLPWCKTDFTTVHNTHLSVVTQRPVLLPLILYSFIYLWNIHIQGVIKSCTDILTTSYWLHVELAKSLKKILCQKIKWHLFFELQFFLIAFSSTLSNNLVGKISAHFKNTACISYFIKRTPMRFPCFKAYFL